MGKMFTFKSFAVKKLQMIWPRSTNPLAARNVKTGPKATKPFKTGDAMLTELRFILEYGLPIVTARLGPAGHVKGHRFVSNLQSTRKPPGLNEWKNHNLQLLRKALPRPAAPIAIAS